jgi:DNA repair protein RecO (recombination protein O)
MRNHSSVSVVLGHKNLGEFDKLIFLYNEDFGKLKAIARGARKITSKFTGHLESLNFCKTQFYFSNKNVLITEIETIKSFKEIRDDLDKTNCALQIAKITDRLLYEGQKVENLQSLIFEALDNINKLKTPNLITTYYIVKLLDKVGIVPNFKEIGQNIGSKYRKFFYFVQNNSLEKVRKIVLEKEEEEEIKSIITRIIDYSS